MVTAARTLALAAAFALLGSAGPAVSTKVDAPCSELRGFVTDRDPHGTNLREAPRSDAPVVAVVPPVGASFELIGSHAGWLLVHALSRSDDLHEPYAHAGSGWLWGGLAGFTIAASELHAGPGAQTPVIRKLQGDGYGSDSFQVHRVYGCRGPWAEVQVQNAAVNGSPLMRGWVDRVCDTQLTTCG